MDGSRLVTCVIGDGLGNRLFQIAAMLGYSERYGHKPVFVKEWVHANAKQPGGERVCDYFPEILTISGESVSWTEVREEFVSAMTYRPLPFIDGNVKLCGAFQSQLYFPKSAISLNGVTGCDWGRPTVFLHIRRGDYLHPFNRHHYVELANYYEKALSLFDSDCGIVVCSDDLAWCKSTLPSRYPFVRADRWIWFSGDEYATLAAMMGCTLGGICANSTFSWWGGYFNPAHDKLIVMPDKWIQAGHGLPQAIDIYPAWAVKVSV